MTCKCPICGGKFDDVTGRNTHKKYCKMLERVIFRSREDVRQPRLLMAFGVQISENGGIDAHYPFSLTRYLNIVSGGTHLISREATAEDIEHFKQKAYAFLDKALGE